MVPVSSFVSNLLYADLIKVSIFKMLPEYPALERTETSYRYVRTNVTKEMTDINPMTYGFIV